MPRLQLSMPTELGCRKRSVERSTLRSLIEQPPARIGAGQRAHDELAARTIRWFACWAGAETSGE